jgi:ABC-type sugar transport system ATPase subunit
MSLNYLPVPRAEGACLIEARDVALSFGETPALRGASVSVAPGEILAIMGPSGSGKSTLLHCLAGILVPESGEILFSARRVDAMREEERSTLRRDHFGFVFQFGQLVPELSAEENVALPLLLGGVRRKRGAKGGPVVVRPTRSRWIGNAPIGRDVWRASTASRPRPCPRSPSRGPLR